MSPLMTATMMLLAAARPTPDERSPAIEPGRLPVAGPVSEVLVVGTPHLSQLPPTFDLAYLAPLLDRLAAFRPDVITIEALSGSDCEYLRRYVAVIPDTASSYCYDPSPARAVTGLDVPAATAAVATREHLKVCDTDSGKLNR